MELKRYLLLTWRWAWLIVLATTVSATISFIVSSRLPKLYSATTTLMVGQVLQSVNPQAQDFSTSQQLAQTYVQLVRRQPALQATVVALGLDQPWESLLGSISAGTLPQTQLMQITAVQGSPQLARVIADEVARQLILQSPTPLEKEQDQRLQFLDEQLSSLQARIKDAEEQNAALEGRLAVETSARAVQDIQGQMTALQQKVATWQSTYAGLLVNKVGRTNNLSIVEPATGPLEPISPSIRTNVLVASAVGLALALAAVLVVEYLDDTFRTREDVERVLQLPTLASVAHVRKFARLEDRLVTWQAKRVPTAEAFHLLRTRLQLAGNKTPTHTLLVTSAGVGEGKTTTSCNLAISMAQSGSNVILCDTDLRRPTIHKLFGLSNGIGLTSLLGDDNIPPDQVLTPTSIAGLSVLSSGPLPPNPSELLGSEHMKFRMAELRNLADVVIFDSPAVLPVADAMIVGALCDAVLLVVAANHTRPETALQAKELLHQVELRMIGVVLNKVRGSRVPGQAYYAAGVPKAGVGKSSQRLVHNLLPWLDHTGAHPGR